MHFTLTTALLLAAAGTGLAAPTTSQAAEVPAGLQILRVDPQPDGGVITWYGDSATEGTTPNEEANPAVINKRCGSNQIECHTSHLAWYSNCLALTVNLNDNQGTMPTSPRSVCLAGPISYLEAMPCCISWSKDAPGARKSHFYNAAFDTYNSCRDWQYGGYRVSGKSKDTNINGVCLTQCLSGRPDGCN